MKPTSSSRVVVVVVPVVPVVPRSALWARTCTSLAENPRAINCCLARSAWLYVSNTPMTVWSMSLLLQLAAWFCDKWLTLSRRVGLPGSALCVIALHHCFFPLHADFLRTLLDMTSGRNAHFFQQHQMPGDDFL